MSRAKLVLGMGTAWILAAACSGSDGAGALVVPDGATGDGGGTGGLNAGSGGRNNGGASTGGSSTGGAGGAAPATGGRDAASGTGGAARDSGIPDGSDSSVNPDGSGSDGAPEAGAPGCPTGGKYSFTFSGSGCGDLDSNAPDQRYDGSNCSGRFE